MDGEASIFGFEAVWVVGFMVLLQDTLGDVAVLYGGTYSSFGF